MLATPALRLRKPLPPVDRRDPPKLRLLFDSGAYTAWKAGKPIDLDAYCDFLIEHQEWIGDYVALDVISSHDPEGAAKASYENYMHMRKRGLNPIPVYHAKENIAWLHRMLDAGATYIGLSKGPLESRNRDSPAWFGSMFNLLCANDGRPIVKVHGFGEGRREVMTDFPWQSTDSASWLFIAGHRALIQMPGGQLVRHRTDRHHKSAEPDLDRLDDIELGELRRFCASVGIDMRAFAERERDSMVLRHYASLLYYLGHGEAVNAKTPVLHNPAGFFHNPRHGKPLDIEHFEFYPVAGVNPIAWACIAFSGHPHTLISYAHIGKDPEALRRFVYDPIGLCEERPRIKRNLDIIREHISHVGFQSPIRPPAIRPD